jgi:nicotinic acid phosphoribosyltransferase
MMKPTNLSMLCDFYQLTMSGGFFNNSFYKKNVCFDMFFRSVPDKGGFAIAAGLEQVISFIQQLRFGDEDIAFLRSKNLFDEAFLEYLRSFRFTGDIYSVPEGTPVFPNVPLLTVIAPAIEAQMIETSGELVYQQPDIEQIRTYCTEQVALLWDEVKRFENPHKYYVDLSEKLWSAKQRLLHSNC